MRTTSTKTAFHISIPTLTVCLPQLLYADAAAIPDSPNRRNSVKERGISDHEHPSIGQWKDDQMVENLPAVLEIWVWRLPAEGNGYPLHYFCLNSMDRGAWRSAVHRATKTQTQLSNYPFHFTRPLSDPPGRNWWSLRRGTRPPRMTQMSDGLSWGIAESGKLKQSLWGVSAWKGSRGLGGGKENGCYSKPQNLPPNFL